MDTFLQDLKYAIRKLSAAPAFTLAAVATLAIGVGATTAIFSTVNATLLRPLPYPHADDLIALRTRYVDGRVTTGLVAAVEAARLNQAGGSIERAVGLSSAPLDATLLRENAPPMHATIHFVGEGFFEVFGVPMALGSDFTHDQQTPIANGPGPGQPQGPPPVVVLSHHAWSDLFGSDPQIVGKTIRFAEINATAIGVASQDLDAPHGADFWANARFNPQDVGHGLNAILRVKPGTTLPRLRSEMAVVMTGLARDFPLSDEGREFVPESIITSIVGDLGPTLLVVFASTALLLLLACVNVTNLLLGRGASRAREVAVRTALGATGGRLVRQLLTESFVVTALGAAAGLGFAYTGVRTLQTLGASKLPRLQSVPFDSHVLGFASIVLVVSAVMLGVAPAVRLARTDLKTLMNESGRSTSGGRGTARMMGVMTILEIALALMLVSGAGWLVQSFARLRSTDPGFATTGRLIVDVRPDPQSVRSVGSDARLDAQPVRSPACAPGRDRRRFDGGVSASRATRRLAVHPVPGRGIRSGARQRLALATRHAGMVRSDGRSACRRPRLHGRRPAEHGARRDRESRVREAVPARERIRCERRSRRAIRTSTREGSSRSSASSATYGTDPLRRRPSRASTCRRASFRFRGRPSSSQRSWRTPRRWRRSCATRSRSSSRSLRSRSTPSRATWPRRWSVNSSG